HAAAEQLVDRLAGRLAEDVPQRDLDARQHADQRRVRALRIAAAVDFAPQALDVERVRAGDIAAEHVLGHRLDDLRTEAVAVDLADATDAVVGRQLDENEVAAAEAGRRIADDENLDVLCLHGAPSPVGETLGQGRSGRKYRAIRGAGWLEMVGSRGKPGGTGRRPAGKSRDAPLYDGTPAAPPPRGATRPPLLL